MQLLMTGLGALIMVAICGLSLFFIIADAQRGYPTTNPKPTGVRDITSQLVDAEPLSLEEVFPEPEIKLVPGAAPYLIGMTHIDTDCDIATTGALGSLLKAHGCTQVVRASMTAPYGGYQVTAGVFNFAYQRDATLIGDLAGKHVEAGDGSFAAMATGLPGTGTGTGTGTAIQPLSQVGWHTSGHFLVYCVIARPDGQVVRDDDQYARRIAGDLVESYLDGTVIGKRTLNP
jgi:hypothetical protein